MVTKIWPFSFSPPSILIDTLSGINFPVLNVSYSGKPADEPHTVCSSGSRRARQTTPALHGPKNMCVYSFVSLVARLCNSEHLTAFRAARRYPGNLIIQAPPPLSSPGIRFLAGTDTSGMRLLSVGLSNSLSLGSLLQSFGASFAADTSDIITINSPSIQYVTGNTGEDPDAQACQAAVVPHCNPWLTAVEAFAEKRSFAFTMGAGVCKSACYVRAAHMSFACGLSNPPSTLCCAWKRQLPVQSTTTPCLFLCSPRLPMQPLQASQAPMTAV